MKKIRLQVDELRVDSFESSSAEKKEGGTVRGAQETWDTCYYTCSGYQTNEGPWDPCVICG
jgi:hypothetical protein